MLHDSGELCVVILSWQKSYGDYMSREHWHLQEKEGCGLFFPFLYNPKTPEDTCYLRVLSRCENWFEETLFLTALCLVVDCYNSKVCHSFNFSFKTCFELAAYFLCFSQCCKFCAVKGRKLTGGRATFPSCVYKRISHKDFGAVVCSALSTGLYHILK